MNDTYQLQRFVDAQRTVYARALQELRNGHKQSHWIWFIFPQMQGLGRSEMAERFGISGAGEAQAYLMHPVLGPRLEECVNALLTHDDRSALDILGSPDDIKLRSSMTLFANIACEHPLFKTVLDRFFEGEEDEKTLFLLGD